MMRRDDHLLVLLAIVLISYLSVSNAAEVVGLPKTGLVRQFYKKHNTCDDLEEYIKHQVKLFWTNDRSITPKLLRLVYSDCFVTGCDASILLDKPDNSEKKAPQNIGLGGFVFIDQLKKVVEKRCPGSVSCADILMLAARDAVHLAGAPSYPVLTGRRDGLHSSAASVDLPSPSISFTDALDHFEKKGLNLLDMVTLLGAHTMGSTRCRYILDRLYNFNGSKKPDPSMDKALLTELRTKCPKKTRKGQTDPLVFLNKNSGTKYNFNNSYYSNVLNKQAVLGIDQLLLTTEDSTAITQEFADGFEDFRKAWAFSMSKMGSIGVLTGDQGEIRRNCRLTNADNPNL
ncbi:Peroxidase [Thalictrum thalictroides]|uniref:Peroxidase n=1 Tax=Thalictrum thalictroides TaxID=46969 RepID=A0A7J6VFU4_THATH|nr:Peroxidase [Thalictrum thalictroides]